MKFKMMTAVSALTLMISIPAFADESGSGPRFVPRPDLALSHYTPADESDDRSDRRTYNAYEHREQCQHYRRIPRNSVELSDCEVMRAPREEVAATATTTTTTTQSRLLPIIHSETIYFDFDRSGIRANQEQTVEKVVSEIATYKPEDITVTGYTDRSGKATYNQKLSARRAHAVSEALKKRGIVNEEVDQEARGETDNAVPTADGVKMQENRRVVVDFRAHT
jgi:OOP family OmpA-OmpF porin